MRRVFVAALVHETHAGSPIPTTLQNYAEGVLVRPETPEGRAAALAALEAFGIVSALAAEGAEAVPGLVAIAEPSLPTRRDVYAALRDGLLADLARAGPVDAVLLHLHGAQMAEGEDDCEGELLGLVRARLPPGVPIGVLFDLHGNVTARMVASGALLVACREYPHTDYAPRARHLAGLLRATVEGRLRPATGFARVPMFGLFPTTQPAMRAFLEELGAREGREGILSITLAHGFPWSDFPDAGASVLVIGGEGQARAQGAAEAIAARFFALYPEINAPTLALAAALDAAGETLRTEPNGPVIIADTADNAGGGAASDNTAFLEAVLARGLQGVGLAMIWDPQAVDFAHALGLGASARLRIGGKAGPQSGRPLDLEGRIAGLHADYRQPALGAHVAMGRMARLDTEGVSIILSERRNQVFDPDCFAALGLDPAAQRLLIVKSAQHFRAAFDPIAARVIYANAPGTMDRDYARLPLRRAFRPVYPRDPVPFTAFGRCWGA